MLLIQLSAGHGPEECTLAVYKAFRFMCYEAQKKGLALEIVESNQGRKRGLYKSVLVSVEGKGESRLSEKEFSKSWQGTMRWICKSPFRPNYGRKNWFFSARVWIPNDADNVYEKDFVIKSCRASGPGGQHVNKTDSAIQITHKPTNIQVKVSNQRSQHRNKQLAIALIHYKIEQQDQLVKNESKADMRMQHHLLERGDPVRTFKGEMFKEVF